MAEEQRGTLVGRTLDNLAAAWRDIAVGAARTVGLSVVEGAPHDEKAMRGLMQACLEARGGEVSARMRAAELGETYLELDEAGRLQFLEILARDFAVDVEAVKGRARAYLESEPGAEQLKAEDELRR
ncbi:MAG: malonyl-CoA decarboxylase, partial [Kiloniellales bacterium]|nr:malonyl-CoA decarboxylase [Kiloniellales bacterium]